MSVVEDFGLAFRSLLARGMATPAVRGRVGLMAASEVWGGGEPRDRPAWYVWLEAPTGVYRLDAEEAMRHDAREGGALIGRLSVRYYPSPLDPDLATFSNEERAIVAGGWLDATGAPCIEKASTIPPALFVVGSIDCAFDADGALTAVALGTLDRLRVTFEDAWVGESYPLGTVVHRAGERVRDVPGWRITRPAFAAIAGLGARLRQGTASRLVVSRQRGFEVVRTRGGAYHRDCHEVVHGEAVVLLGPEPNGEGVLGALLEGGGERILDVNLSPHGTAWVCPDVRLELDIESSWFGRDGEPGEVIACSCG